MNHTDVLERIKTYETRLKTLEKVYEKRARPLREKLWQLRENLKGCCPHERVLDITFSENGPPFRMCLVCNTEELSAGKDYVYAVLKDEHVVKTAQDIEDK